ncbi:unnamed protein product [Protopolystoma xenopodis]|uniref:Uncharacterized protein n=1 Tax=Protopolystoma xenopodis TaxID=117903 RepID=A0A3S5CHH5_9PLAT|nr:unnamed protein product [Protopolystoma xenopodis]
MTRFLIPALRLVWNPVYWGSFGSHFDCRHDFHTTEAVRPQHGRNLGHHQLWPSWVRGRTLCHWRNVRRQSSLDDGVRALVLLEW